MIDAAKNVRDRLIVLVMYDSGVRRFELVNLRIDDIEFLDETIVIRKGKGDNPRRIKVSSSLISELSEFIKSKTEEQVELEYLFLSNRKSKLGKRRINDIIEELRERAEINKNITPHTLRRTFATIWYYANDYDIKELRDLMGHASVKTTEKYI